MCGSAAAVGELFLGFDFGASGFGWIDGLGWSFLIGLGVYLLVFAHRWESGEIAKLQNAREIPVAFVLHSLPGGDSPAFGVRILSEACVEAGSTNWKGEIRYLMNENFLMNRLGQHKGKAWFDFRAAEPLAIEVDGTVFLLKKVVPG